MRAPKPRFRVAPARARSLGPQIARFAKAHGMTLDPLAAGGVG
jgi:hypothetical protein